jgi:hypothetical protein
MSMNNMNERKLIIKTGYGTAWNENDKIKVKFASMYTDQPVYNITDLDLSAAIGYNFPLTIRQVLGSWGPSNELKMFLEKRMAK